MTIARIPLAQPIESRTNSLAKDARGSNVYYDTNNGRKEVRLRPGTQSISIAGPDNITGYPGQGLYYWWSSGYMYGVSNNNIYQMNAGGYCKKIGTMSGTPVIDKVSINQTRSVPWMTIQNGEKIGRAHV